MVITNTLIMKHITNIVYFLGADPELDPLKWVEENIPDVEGALPMIDSEEEIETTKAEISKLH